MTKKGESLETPKSSNITPQSLTALGINPGKPADSSTRPSNPINKSLTNTPIKSENPFKKDFKKPKF